MKCIYCGAWTYVLATRKGRRRRRCGNDHSFHTLETAEVNPNYLKRQIVERVKLGATPEAVAESFRIPLDEVQAALKAH